MMGPRAKTLLKVFLLYFVFNNILGFLGHLEFRNSFSRPGNTNIPMMFLFWIFTQIMWAIPTIPIASLFLIYKSHRDDAIRCLVFATTVLCCYAGWVNLNGHYESVVLHECVRRGRPEVDAIEAYDASHGKPPKALSELVPEYLPAIPTPGFGAFPEFKYLAGEQANKYFNDHPWALYLTMDEGLLEHEPVLLVYVPDPSHRRMDLDGWSFWGVDVFEDHPPE